MSREKSNSKMVCWVEEVNTGVCVHLSNSCYCAVPRWRSQGSCSMEGTSSQAEQKLLHLELRYHIDILAPEA